MARVPASSETLGAPPVSDASPLCSCRVAGVPREAGAWRRGDQPSAAAVAWQAATVPPPPPRFAWSPARSDETSEWSRC